MEYIKEATRQARGIPSLFFEPFVDISHAVLSLVLSFDDVLGSNSVSWWISHSKAIYSHTLFGFVKPRFCACVCVIGYRKEDFNFQLLVLQQKQVAFASTLVQLILKLFISYNNASKLHLLHLCHLLDKIINDMPDMSLLYMSACNSINRNPQQ